MVRLFFFVLLSQGIFAQFFWQASSEIGYYNSTGNYFQKEDEVLTRLNLKTGYSYKSLQKSADIDFQIRPEIYGIKNRLQSTGISLNGDYNFMRLFSINSTPYSLAIQKIFPIAIGSKNL